MSSKLGPYIFQSARQSAPPANKNDRQGESAQLHIIADARNAAFKSWLSHVSYTLNEWELELMGHATPMSTFETIAAFKDVLEQS